MPTIRIKLTKDWYDSLRAAAEKRKMTTEELILESLAVSHPAPGKKSWYDSEHAARQAAHLCAVLQSAKNEILEGLQRLEPLAREPRPDLALKRQRIGTNLRKAMKAKGLRHVDLARYIGVSRPFVTSILNGRVSLPPAWIAPLSQLLGGDWMSE